MSGSQWQGNDEGAASENSSNWIKPGDGARGELLPAAVAEEPIARTGVSKGRGTSLAWCIWTCNSGSAGVADPAIWDEDVVTARARACKEASYIVPFQSNNPTLVTMHFLAPVLLFSATISAISIPRLSSKRDTAETLRNLQAIDTATRQLTTTVQQYDGSLLGALGINGASQNLGNQIDSANAAAQDEPPTSSADSQTIITFITGTLEPDIAASLNALVAKKPQFDNIGLSGLVLTNLQSLRQKTASYSATLVGIASADQAANARAAAAKIDADFARAIASFS
ncbi:MAG: hypothetical protein Q9160_008565 [Pyrenula sp. 1 TL-2023]